MSARNKVQQKDPAPHKSVTRRDVRALDILLDAMLSKIILESMITACISSTSIPDTNAECKLALMYIAQNETYLVLAGYLHAFDFAVSERPSFVSVSGCKIEVL